MSDLAESTREPLVEALLALGWDDWQIYHQADRLRQGLFAFGLQISKAEKPAETYEQVADLIEWIGAEVKGWRDDRKVSLSQAAKEMGVAKSFLYRVEQGESHPSVLVAGRMLRWCADGTRDV